MKVLFLAGSLRADSLNKKLAKEAKIAAESLGVACEFIDLKEYQIPLYDGDLEDASGLPQGVVKLGQQIKEATALVISTPEYNGSIPAVLKNMIDWLSREKPMSLNGKHLLLLAATMGGLSGVRGLWHTRVPFEAINVHVFPAMMGVPQAHTVFDAQGKLTDTKLQTQLQNTIQNFVTHISKK